MLKPRKKSCRAGELSMTHMVFVMGSTFFLAPIIHDFLIELVAEISHQPKRGRIGEKPGLVRISPKEWLRLEKTRIAGSIFAERST
jgi:hypothetical protein